MGVPTVEFDISFRSPIKVEAILSTGNCVFLSALYGIGTNGERPLRRVFSYMEEESVKSAVMVIYGESFDECIQNRSSDIGLDQTVCVLVIYGLVTLLGVDICWEKFEACGKKFMQF